jgi:hypothetical protein
MDWKRSGRRNFLKTAGLATGGVLLGGPTETGLAEAARAATNKKGNKKLTTTTPMIEAPFHGAVLNHRHGKMVADGMIVHVTGHADAGEKVTVNGLPARRKGESFEADVILRQKETTITAKAANAAGTNREHVIRVVWDRYSRPRYRFSIDDNSFFLRDVAQKGYASLFDCFYLKILRDLNAKYGTRFVLNIYYTTGDDFNLTQFPDRYRGEWIDNADWLKLAFHAYANDPARPYQHASPQKLIADLDLVAGQIVRFAGEETYTPPTVIHWGMVTPAALEPLAGRGVRALSGYFRFSAGHWDVNYRFDDDRSEYLSRHDALMDFQSGIVFSRVDIVCNSTPVEKTVPTLAPLADDPNTAEIMDLFTHEQYFWPFYENHVPDHAERLETAIRWVTEQGYKPVFFHEGFLGGSE